MVARHYSTSSNNKNLRQSTFQRQTSSIDVLLISPRVVVMETRQLGLYFFQEGRCLWFNVKKVKNILVWKLFPDPSYWHVYYVHVLLTNLSTGHALLQIVSQYRKCNNDDLVFEGFYHFLFMLVDHNKMYHPSESWNGPIAQQT